MSRKSDKFAIISARICRVEKKCNRLIAEVSALREALRPTHSEIDEVIGQLHKAAIVLRNQSRDEFRHYALKGIKE